MVKIINQKTEKCYTCGCLFSYEDEDIREHSGISFDYTYVNCPKCGGLIFLDSIEKPNEK